MEPDEDQQQQPPPVMNAREQHFQPSPGARITYQELVQFPERDPPEEHFEPEIHRAVTYADVRENPDDPPPVYLMRQFDATEAYALIDKAPIRLRGHGGWGVILFAVTYTRTNNMPLNTFQVPREQDAQYVAIKRLDKARVNHYLQQGGKENPYKEISRMRALGDNEHVLRCIDALEDDKYLYIITPKASEEGTLLDVIGRAPVDSVRARKIFIKILKILAYLEAHGICHRDFTPDNLLFLTPDNLVVFDLAMSHRLPVNDAGHRVLSAPQGIFGKFPYMPPEVFINRVFDGVHVDLWAAAVILYNMLTRRVPYFRPDPTDILFCFNIFARSVSDTPINEDTLAIQQRMIGQPYGTYVLRILEIFENANRNLSPAAAELLGNLLHFEAGQRWCLAQAMKSDYVELGD